MLLWLSHNIGTIIVCTVLLIIVADVIIYLIKRKRSGKTSCGCGCEGCPNSSYCHK